MQRGQRPHDLAGVAQARAGAAGRAAPALATMAVPMTAAYQFGPRWRTEAAAYAGRGGAGRGGAVHGMTMLARVARAGRRSHQGSLLYERHKLGL